MKALVSKFAAVAFSLFASVSQAGVVYNWVSTLDAEPSVPSITARIEFATPAWRTGAISYNVTCSFSFCDLANPSAIPVLAFSFFAPNAGGVAGTGGFNSNSQMRVGSLSASFSFQGEVVTASALHFDIIIQGPSSVDFLTGLASGSARSGGDQCFGRCQRSLAGFWQVDKSTIPAPGTFPLIGASLGVLMLARRRASR